MDLSLCKVCMERTHGCARQGKRDGKSGDQGFHLQELSMEKAKRGEQNNKQHLNELFCQHLIWLGIWVR